MGLACQCFHFVVHAIELHTATGEGILVGHYLVQFENYQINCAGSSSFYN